MSWTCSIRLEDLQFNFQSSVLGADEKKPLNGACCRMHLSASEPFHIMIQSYSVGNFHMNDISAKRPGWHLLATCYSQAAKCHRIPCSWWAAALLQVHKLWLPHSLTANYTCRQQWQLQWLWVCPKIWYSEILSVNHHFPPMTSSHLGFFQYIISIYTIFRHTQILVHIGSLR